ncbi:GspH/FimT family protein [Celerinatantimonas sp. MCCC 1A17872]|uniref:GspH/FimT family protein n=1 Tax=Celerinatantimonas sp. MCCC 1A17872 TaxID=3177514 RepID=UPI0038C1F848
MLIATCLIALFARFSLSPNSYFIQSQQLQQAAQSLISSLRWAKLQALQTQNFIQICSLSNTQECQDSWINQISIFIDEDGNGELNGEDELLKTIELPQAVQINGSRSHIRINNRGFAYGYQQTLYLCENQQARAITVSAVANFHVKSAQCPLADGD